MATVWRQFLRYRRTSASLFNPFPSNGANFPPHPHSSRFSSKPQPPEPDVDYPICTVKVGVPEFLKGVGGGLEAHVAKIESEIGDFNKLLVTRMLGLKKLSIPCKHRKLILKYAHKYRLGLWRPPIDAPKA